MTRPVRSINEGIHKEAQFSTALMPLYNSLHSFSRVEALVVPEKFSHSIKLGWYLENRTLRL
jgi:hypothetical protein